MNKKKVTTREFNSILQDYSDQFVQAGFKKTEPKTYVNSRNIQLKFVLDKWGWSEDEGSAFVARLSDLNFPVGELRNIHPKDQKELSKYYLLEANLISRKNFGEIYDNQPKSVKEAFNKSPWFVYYHDQNLRTVLDLVLPVILSEASAWRENDMSSPNIVKGI